MKSQPKGKSASKFMKTLSWRPFTLRASQASSVRAWWKKSLQFRFRLLHRELAGFLKKIVKLHIKFARYRAIRGPSYLALTHKLALANCRDLLNIRNQDDANCIIFYFVTAYHAHHGISLGRDNTNYHIKKTSPATYQQAKIPQTDGIFGLPMAFEKMKAFQTLNDVTINVIGYDKGQLYSFCYGSFTYLCCRHLSLCSHY